MNSEPIKKPEFRLTRLFSLDVIRGIAAFFMVNGHFIYDTMSKDPKLQFTKSFFFMAENFIYTVGWTMFFLIIGIGLAISTQRYKLKKVSFEVRLYHVLKRTIILVIIQYVYNLVNFGFLSSDYYKLYFGPYSNTDFTYFFNPISSFSHSNLIAQIALWSFVVFILMELPTVARVIIAVVVAYFGYYVFAVQGNMFFYILTGEIFGTYLVNELGKGNTERVYKLILFFGIILFCIGLPLHIVTVNNRIFVDNIFYISQLIQSQSGKTRLYSGVTNYADYLASPGFILYSLGAVFMLFASLFWILDVKKKKSKIFRPFILWGNLTLTLYVTHFILLYQFVYNLELYLYFSLVTFMTWNLLLCIFIYIGAVFWSRYKFKYSLEWIIRKYS